MMASGSRNRDNFTCPICMYIMIQPVTMPCEHSLCMLCYKQCVEKANLACPICRRRISVWARKCSKTNTLMNEEMWETIQNLFPVEIRNQMEGKDTSDESCWDSPSSIATEIRRIKELSEPGAIREEYEAALAKLERQKAEEAAKEEAASNALIQALQEEDEKELAKLNQDREEAERLSRAVAQQMQDVEHIDKETRAKTRQTVVKTHQTASSPANSKRCESAGIVTLRMEHFYNSINRKGLRSLPSDSELAATLSHNEASSLKAGNDRTSNYSPYPYICVSPSNKGSHSPHSSPIDRSKSSPCVPSILEADEDEIRSTRNSLVSSSLRESDDTPMASKNIHEGLHVLFRQDFHKPKKTCSSNGARIQFNVKGNAKGTETIAAHQTDIQNFGACTSHASNLSTNSVKSKTSSKNVLDGLRSMLHQDSFKSSKYNASKTNSTEESENEIDTQLQCSFQPIATFPRTPPKKTCSGEIVGANVVNCIPKSLTFDFDGKKQSSSSNSLCSSQIITDQCLYDRPLKKSDVNDHNKSKVNNDDNNEFIDKMTLTRKIVYGSSKYVKRKHTPSSTVSSSTAPHSSAFLPTKSLSVDLSTSYSPSSSALSTNSKFSKEIISGPDTDNDKKYNVLCDSSDYFITDESQLIIPLESDVVLINDKNDRQSSSMGRNIPKEPVSKKSSKLKKKSFKVSKKTSSSLHKKHPSRKDPCLTLSVLEWCKSSKRKNESTEHSSENSENVQKNPIDSDLAYALELQKMFDEQDKRNIQVDRFHGSDNEYAFRKRQRFT